MGEHTFNGLRAWLGARLPPTTPHAAALFRIVFVSAAIYLLHQSALSVDDLPAPLALSDLPLLQRLLVAPFVLAPSLVEWLDICLLVSGGLVVVGLWATSAFAVFVWGAVSWGAIHSLRYGHHPYSAFLVALVMLLPARWSDCWSIDSWRRPRTLPMVSPDYSYARWVPALVLTLTLTAAAVTKLRMGGIGWILNGTVKYHWMTDATNAHVSWGRYVGLAPPLVAIFLSFCAIAIEAAALPLVLSGRAALRVIACIAVVLLLSGFYLFQGLFWLGWWLLLLPFLPWTAVGAALTPSHHPVPNSHGDRPARMGLGACVAVALLVAQQIAASALLIEAPPLVSAYDMYSGTYSSPSAYERAATEYWLVVSTGAGEDVRCRIPDIEGPSLIAAFPQGYTHPLIQANAARCAQQAEKPLTLRVDMKRTVVDWEHWRIVGREERTEAGPLVIPPSEQ